MPLNFVKWHQSNFKLELICPYYWDNILLSSLPVALCIIKCFVLFCFQLCLWKDPQHCVSSENSSTCSFSVVLFSALSSLLLCIYWWALSMRLEGYPLQIFRTLFLGTLVLSPPSYSLLPGTFPVYSSHLGLPKFSTLSELRELILSSFYFPFSQGSLSCTACCPVSENYYFIYLSFFFFF